MASLIEQLIARRAAEQGSATGLQIPQILSPAEMSFMQSVWGQIRVAASFADINWQAAGYPDGPPLSPSSYAAITYVWPQIRVAADFSHPQWANHLVPEHIVAAALPVPEADGAAVQPTTPTAPATVSPATVAPAVSTYPGSGSYYQGYSPDTTSDYPLDDPAAAQGAQVQKAGMFGSLPLPAILAGVGLILYMSLAKGAMSLKPRRARGRRRR